MFVVSMCDIDEEDRFSHFPRIEVLTVDVVCCNLSAESDQEVSGLLVEYKWKTGLLVD